MFANKADFKQTFLDYYNPLCNYANKILHDAMAAEDVVQDVFIYMWDNRETIKVQNGIKAYIFKSTHNKALEYLRSQKVRLAAKQKADFEAIESADHDEISDVYLRMERLNNSLRHLPPKCREVFVLHKFKGLTYAEIADSKNIALKTVENHLLKAMKILRSLLKD
ncbi:MAG: RNA polymerase sigma-70 factor [Saprospiraceae bacterium]|nr:RNA polymerase sigma-70 factor [Saprospiraceae bacterium]